MTWLLPSSCGCCNGHATDFSLGVFGKAHLESQCGANCPPQHPAVWAECLIGVWQGGRRGDREEMGWWGGRMGPKLGQGDYGHWDRYQITRPFPKHVRCSCGPVYFSRLAVAVTFCCLGGWSFFFFFFNKSFSIPSPVVPDVWFTESMRTASKRANKSKAETLKLQGGWLLSGSVNGLSGSCGVFTSGAAVDWWPCWVVGGFGPLKWINTH